MKTRKRLILVGAGHAHLLLTEHLRVLCAAGLDPLLIAPRWFHYSGLATAILSGALPPDANRIDVAALARRRGLDFIDATVIAIDRRSRTVMLEDGTSRDFDLLSINTGSDVAVNISGQGEIWPAKPLDTLTRLNAALTARCEACPAIVVAGAGPSGSEIAASLAGLCERRGWAPNILLVGMPVSGPGWGGLYASIEARGVRLMKNRHVMERTPDHIVLDNEATSACEFLVAATGLRSSPLGSIVSATLQTLDDAAIFACGDCAEFTPSPLPKLGVFGVREAPILVRNLIAAAQGAALAGYRPQRHWLSILDLGNDEGFATRGRFHYRGRAALRLKRRLDLGFVRRFQIKGNSR